MKCLVTGGLGFIGSNFIASASKKGYQIYNVDKFTYASHNPSYSQKSLNKIKNFKFSLENKSKINNLIMRFDPDLIVDFAAESHVDRSIDDPGNFVASNITSSINLLESFRELIKKKRYKKRLLVHISTDEVYGSLSKYGKKFTELNKLDPSSPYASSKASSDLLFLSWQKTYDLPIILTNCSNNYGPFQHPEKLIPNLIHRLINNNTLDIYGDGLNVRDWLHVDDHVAAIHRVINKGKVGETYNVGGNNEKTNLEIVEKLIKLIDKKTSNKKKDMRDNIRFVEDRPAHDIRYAVNISKIKKHLDWKPMINFTQGLDKTVDWYLEFYNSKYFDKNYKLKRLGLNK